MPDIATDGNKVTIWKEITRLDGKVNDERYRTLTDSGKRREKVSSQV